MKTDSTKYPHRQIRSFICRSGRMTLSQKQALEDRANQYLCSLEEGLINLDQLYARNSRRILEIGFGMGKSLLIQAQENPQEDFLGIEVHKPGIGHVLSEITKNNLTNIRLFCADAVAVIESCIPDTSLDCVQIFFPDPWPKRKHHKRRLIQKNFVELIAKKLKPNGVLHLATDWEDYAKQMLSVVNETKLFTLENNVSHDRPNTKYELRGKRLGHKIWDFRFLLK